MLGRRNAGETKSDYTNKASCFLDYYVRLVERKRLVPVLARPFSFTYCLLLIVLALPAPAGINKKLGVKPDTREGNFIELINLENDFEKGLALIEQFTLMFPGSDSIGWAYSQIQDASLKDGQLDRAIHAGDKLLELDPDDLEAARVNVQAARRKDDQSLIKKYSDLSGRIAQRVASAPVSIDDPEEAAAQKKRLELAANLLARQEYEIYDLAFNAADPQRKIGALDELLKLNPHTRYLNEALLIYYLAYRQLNDAAKAVAAGKRLLPPYSSLEDNLLLVDDKCFRRDV